MSNPALYQLALTHIPGIGTAYTKKLVTFFGDAESVFHTGRKTLEKTGIGTESIDAILQFHDWNTLNKELDILAQKQARVLFFTDPDYPRRLLPLAESPALLFYQGTVDLNAAKVVSVVGTRAPTDYGREMTEQLIGQLAQQDMLIVSGLAYGIDAAAHAAALQHNLPTIAALGNGLSHCYPRAHVGLARSIRQKGGLLTPFPWGKGPISHHFPTRNKIIAGMCDALIVAETGETGGSLITADDAYNYGKKIFAVPGRLTDKKSAGCLNLIRLHKAVPLISGDQLQSDMGWQWPAGRKGSPATLSFPVTENQLNDPDPSATQTDATGQDAPFLQLLRDKESLSLDELTSLSRMNASSVAMSLLNLELKGLIHPLPGKRYRLSH